MSTSTGRPPASFVPPTACGPNGDLSGADWGNPSVPSLEFVMRTQRINTGPGLTGGGALVGDLTISLARPLSADTLGGNAASYFAPAVHTHPEMDNFLTQSEAEGLFIQGTEYLSDGDALRILELIKLVDGAGSGIDADLVDGKHAIELGGTGGTGGVTEHGLLLKLDADDHPQYLNTTRGDVRYYTKTAADALINARLTQAQADARYYTKAEVDTKIAAAGGQTQAQADARYVKLAGDTMTGSLTVNTSSITLGTANLYGVGEAFLGMRIRPPASGGWARGVNFFKAGTGVAGSDLMGTIGAGGVGGTAVSYYYMGLYGAEWLKQDASELWTINNLNAQTVQSRSGTFQSLGTAMYLLIGTSTFIRNNPTGDTFINLGVSRTVDGNTYLDFVSAIGSSYTTRLIQYPGKNGAFIINHLGTGVFTVRMAEGSEIAIESGVAAKNIVINSAGVTIHPFGTTNKQVQLNGSSVALYGATSAGLFSGQTTVTMRPTGGEIKVNGVLAVEAASVASSSTRAITFGYAGVVSAYFSTGPTHSRLQMAERTLGENASGPVVAIARNVSGASGVLAIQEGQGTWRYYYATGGVLMQASLPPTPNALVPTGAVAVGAQTSSIRYKTLPDTPVLSVPELWETLHKAADRVKRFTYKSGLYQGDVLEGIILDPDHAETRRYGLGKQDDTPEGTALNEVNLFGDLLRAVVDLSKRLQTLEEKVRGNRE